MARMAVAAAVVVLVGVFAAVAVSVVHVLRPVDGRVSRSFDVTLSRLAGRTKAQPGGCRKLRLYYYACGADVKLREGPSSTVYWQLVLRGDGCWSAAPYPRYLQAAVRQSRKLASIKACGA